MKFIRFGEKFNSNDALLSEIGMIFSTEPFNKEDFAKPLIYDLVGNYIRLTPVENDLLSLGKEHTYPEDDDYFISRKELFKLFQQRETLKEQKLQVYYLIMENDHFEFTSTFPTKYALLLKKGDDYKVIECDDPDLKILAEFLTCYKKTHNRDDLFENKRTFAKKIDWPLDNLTLKPAADFVRISNEKDLEIELFITHLANLMTEWQKLLTKDPEKIYLVLENGHYRLTTDYEPKEYITNSKNMDKK